MPKEDSIREKSLSRWAARQGLDLARVSKPKLGRGFFLVDWEEEKFVVGGPMGTLSDIENWLRANIPQPPKPPKRR
jgi:hypothetical protein